MPEATRQFASLLAMAASLTATGCADFAQSPLTSSNARAASRQANLIPVKAPPGEQVLYSFPGTIGGLTPTTEVTIDKGGDIYGTTNGGGGLTIFELEKTALGFKPLGLYDGTQNTGERPSGQVIVDSSGDIFGTSAGNSGSCSGNCGTVYELQPLHLGGYYLIRAYYFTTAYSNPNGIVEAPDGTFYGTTQNDGHAQRGTVFRLTPTASGFAYKIVHDFKGGNDGSIPMAPLIEDATGAFYGTTSYGGRGTGCTGGCGTVFKLTPSGSSYVKTELYNFQGGTDGGFPATVLLEDSSGTLYGGTTVGGGSTACSEGCGTVFELVPGSGAYTERVLHVFQGGDGQFPGAVAFGKGGVLYGVTAGGGAYGKGTIFSLTTRANPTQTTLHSFGSGTDGAYPSVGLVAHGKTFFGTTSSGGGASASGTVFEFTP
jgi:uncharacterized repeat protein (TIGR03803 family)